MKKVNLTLKGATEMFFLIKWFLIILGIIAFIVWFL